MTIPVEFTDNDNRIWTIIPLWSEGRGFRDGKEMLEIRAELKCNSQVAITWTWRVVSQWEVNSPTPEQVTCPVEVCNQMCYLRIKFLEQEKVAAGVRRDAEKERDEAARKVVKAAHEESVRLGLQLRDQQERQDAERWARIARMVIEMLQAEP